MALYTLTSKNDFARLNRLPSADQTQLYNALGRDAGSQSGNPNFFEKKWNSIENAIGTTLAVPAAKAYMDMENLGTEQMVDRQRNSLEDIVKKYGYGSTNDFWDEKEKTENEIYGKYGYDINKYWDDRSKIWTPSTADSDEVKNLDAQRDQVIAGMSQEDADKIRNLNNIENELRGQSASNAQEATDRANAFKDWSENNYIGKKINQDRGKFLGSAMNTLSTGFDVLSMAAGIPNGALINGAQGAWEGIADELEQNGWDNFDWGRAGQNAAIGAAAGAATGALNKKINSNLLKKDGNLFKGGNMVTRAINDFNENKTAGKVLSTLGSGIARGAQSGAVGGAVGAGLSSAMNQVDLGQGIGNTIQGAIQGAGQGAVTGGVMAGANMATNAALNKYAPTIANKIRANQARNAEYGDTMREQFKGAWNSGDSAVAENVLKPMASKVDNFVDNTRTRIINRNAIGRLTNALDSAMEGGARGNTKFVRIGNDLLDDLNNIRVENGLDPLTNRQVTAYENAINNNLINRVKEGMSTSDVALMAFNALTSDSSKVVPGYYNNQLVVSEPGMVNDYDGTVLGLAEDGGTSLKSIEPRNRSQIEMFEENGQQKMGPRSRLGSSPAEEQPVNDSILPQSRQNVNSQWDNIAQEAGYRNYDEVIQRFVEANPNTQVNAGAVLTWMDNNPGEWNPNMRTLNSLNPTGTVNTEYDPTFRATAPLGEDMTTYAQTAGLSPDQEVTIYRGVPRGVEDGINAGDYVTTNRQLAQDYAGDGRVIEQRVPASSLLDSVSEPLGEEYIYRPQSTETEVYRTLTAQNEQPRIKTSKQIKAKREIVKDITDQFENVDRPTARATKPNETFYNLYEEWGLSDGDDIRQAVSYAEPGGLVPKLIREAAGEAGVIDLSDAEGLIAGLKIGKKNYGKYVDALEDIMESTDTTIFGGKQGVDALELQRTLESMASDARGTNGTYHIGNTIVDETMARNFQRIANSIGDKLDEAVVAKGTVKNVLNRHSDEIAQMRNAFNDSKSVDVQKWQDTIDSKIIGAKTIRDLRSAIKEPTRASIFIRNGDENYSTFGSKMASKSNDIPTTKTGVKNRLINDLYDKFQNSSVARNARLAKNASIVKNTPTIEAGTITEGEVVTPDTTATTATVDNPATRVYDIIGRNEGLSNGEQVRTANYLSDAVQEANAVPKAPNAGAVTSLESLVAPTTTGTTSVYDSVYSTPTTATTAASRNTGYFQPTGDYWTDILATAMSSAIDNDDVEAFAALYGMYQDLISKLQSSSSSQQKLTATQQRANAAMNSLNRLANMTPDLAYNLSSIPIVGGIATLGGNDYEAEAKSLAQQIGYMVSGSNIKDSEAEAIGKSYVPQPWDNEQVRENKLRRAYSIIQQYQNSYAE